MKWAMAQNQPGLSAGAKMVLMVLADAYNQRAQRDPYLSLKTLGHISRVKSKTTLSKHIQELERLGLLERYNRPNASNIYALSGAPDFKVDVQKLDTEGGVSADIVGPVSGPACPVSEGGGPENDHSMSSNRPLTTKTTKLITKENHASERQDFSADEDSGFSEFLTSFKTEPKDYREAEFQYDQAIVRGTQPSILLVGAIKYARMVHGGFWEEMDPADWLRQSKWIEPRKVSGSNG
jgi:hypothetical protein